MLPELKFCLLQGRARCYLRSNQGILLQIAPGYKREPFALVLSKIEVGKAIGGNHSDKPLLIKKINIRFLQDSAFG